MVINLVNQFIAHHKLIHPNQTIIIGFSGGPDSTFLLYYLQHISAEYQLTLIAAHLDHEWRASSINDRRFCEEFCKKNNITLITAQASSLTVAKKNTGSKEELGRLLRRTFFEKIKKEYNADSIALAHHLDDQLETFFIRLIRGASVAGLASMRACQDGYIRPLLCLRKQDILNFLEQHKIGYVIDPTNESLDYLRNRIRLSLVPALEQVDKRYFDSIMRTITNIQETDDFLQKLAQLALIAISEERKSKDDSINISLEKFLALDPFLQRLVITQWLCVAQVSFVMTTLFIEEIIRFLGNTKSTTHQFNQWTIVKKRGHAQIVKT